MLIKTLFSVDNRFRQSVALSGDCQIETQLRGKAKSWVIEGLTGGGDVDARMEREGVWMSAAKR
jgi:hypothetical protein